MKDHTGIVMCFIFCFVSMFWMLHETGKLVRQVNALRQDSTATHSELEHLKRELRKCNSDSTIHAKCFKLK